MSMGWRFNSILLKLLSPALFSTRQSLGMLITSKKVCPKEEKVIRRGVFRLRAGRERAPQAPFSVRTEKGGKESPKGRCPWESRCHTGQRVLLPSGAAKSALPLQQCRLRFAFRNRRYLRFHFSAYLLPVGKLSCPHSVGAVG